MVKSPINNPEFPPLPTSNPDSENLQQAMESLHGDTVFPVPNGDYRDIGSTFMYRTEIDTNSEDFHRAIDIGGEEGDNIVAAYPGTFWGYRNYSGAGRTVRLQHKFPQPFTYKGRTVSHFYTWYSHLNHTGTHPIVAGWVEGKTEIKAGQLLGKMGQSGDTKIVHLDFAVRIGTNNSLRFQLCNPGSTQWGFDPHIHPMMLYAASSPSPEPSLSLVSTANGNLRVRYITDRQQPILNRVETKILQCNSPNPIVVKSHTLDLNLREGIVPPGTTTCPPSGWLDNLDKQKPHFDPIPFGFNASRYQTEIVVPSVWLDANSLRSTENTIQIEVVDIWGSRVSGRYQIGDAPEI